MKKLLAFLLCIAIGSGIAYFSVVNWGISLAEVSGSSMEPTYYDMDKVLVKRYTLFFRNPAKGDVVIIWNPKDNCHDIKRIAAVPGDVLILLNGTKRYSLGKDQYFVLGDNSANSWDSRYYGPIHKVQILGIVEP